jgi:hypothetical protein
MDFGRRSALAADIAILVGGQSVPAGRCPRLYPERCPWSRPYFAAYLELGSVHALERRLREEGIRSQRYITVRGHLRGGAYFGRGALFHLLRNRVYLGKITHRGRRGSPSRMRPRRASALAWGQRGAGILHGFLSEAIAWAADMAPKGDDCFRMTGGSPGMAVMGAKLWPGWGRFQPDRFWTSGARKQPFLNVGWLANSEPWKPKERQTVPTPDAQRRTPGAGSPPTPSAASNARRC